MSHPIDKKAVYMARYPKGTIIELVEPLEDPYAPKPVGSRFKVNCVDDALQLQGVWLPPQSGSIAVIIEKDKFKIVAEKEATVISIDFGNSRLLLEEFIVIALKDFGKCNQHIYSWIIISILHFTEYASCDIDIFTLEFGNNFSSFHITLFA